MFNLPDILIKYRVDKRIRVVEITYKSHKFLVSLEDFMQDTGIRDFEESTRGEAYVGPVIYSQMSGKRL